MHLGVLGGHHDGQHQHHQGQTDDAADVVHTGHDARVIAEGEARGQHLGRIDDAHTGEGPELVGAEVEPVADEGEDEERQQAEHEHHGDGVGDVFILGPDGRGDGHTGRDPADGQAGGQTGPQ